MRRGILAFMAGLFLGDAALAEAPLTLRPDDEVRMAALDESLGGALREALAGGAPADVAALTGALAGAALPPAEAQAILPGDWSCQMLKLGRITPLVVYPPFRCTAGADGAFAKVTGSQRTRGRIAARGDRLVYAGTGHVAGDDPVPYADLPEAVDPAAVPQLVPEVGLVEVVSPSRARIILPAPHLESRTNILLLTRP